MQRRAFLVVVSIVACGTVLGAQDWPQWRGPARDGAIPAAGVPSAWPASFARVWRTDVGEGYASPIVSGGRVFVHSRTDPDEVLTALDLATGKVVWQQRYAAAFAKNSYATSMAKGPNATPLAAGGRVFTLGVTGILTAWEAATGRQVWRQDYSSRVDSTKLFCGTAASPLLVSGALVVQVGSDTKGGQILALDPATGATRWTWTGLGPGYASPVVVSPGGTAQLVTLTEGSVIGLDPATGKELWAAAFPDDWHENIVTPVWTGTHLIVSGVRQGTHAYAIEKSGTTWRATQAWRNAAVTMYMTTPVVGDGLIYGLSSKQRGQFVALDAKTGEIKWTTQGREGEFASLLLTPSHLVALVNGGDLIVARRGGTAFVSEKRYTVAESPTWTMPVFLGRDLLVRDATGVMRLAGK
jgi:outer membrane protein assembly factor BamB